MLHRFYNVFMLSRRQGICKRITGTNWEIINPNALGKGIIYITWASAKVCPIVFPNPYQPSLQGHCFLMHNKKSNQGVTYVEGYCQIAVMLLLLLYTDTNTSSVLYNDKNKIKQMIISLVPFLYCSIIIITNRILTLI